MKHRKIMTLLSLLLIFAFSLSMNSLALLNWNSTDRCVPGLAIIGNSALCELTVVTNDSTDNITAYIYLERILSDGSLDMVTSWTGLTATGKLAFSESYPIDSSGSYQMRITVIVNGSGGTDVITDVV